MSERALTRRRRVQRTFRQLRALHGTAAALVYVPVLLWHAVAGRRPAANPADRFGAAFDETHDVDTGGIIPIAHLEVSDPNWVYGCDYQAVEVFDIEALLADLGVDFRVSEFVDLGAGKGRALMVASSAPFRRLVGVEIVPSLAALARANIARYCARSANADRFEIICGDAGDYAFGAAPQVVFMYNPFSAPIMAAVIANVGRALAQHGERIIVVYFRPELEAMWHAVPGMHLVRATARYRIFDSVPARHGVRERA